MTEFSGPLSGIKVLDLTTVFMGPSATQMLGDLGADVIKVEAPGGDSTRTLGPNGEYGLGPLFLGLNRNKRSIVIDLKSAAGAELLLELTKSADVLATNIRPAAMARLGLGYARLAELNPQLIYASMVGFSQKGPYGPKAAYDDMMQAASGLAALLAAFGDALCACARLAAPHISTPVAKAVSTRRPSMLKLVPHDCDWKMARERVATGDG